MAGKLVTIARFDLAGQAHIAKNALEAVGIKSVLADEQTVAMDWLLSNAIGGIKVQVLEEDAERAVTALEESLGSDEPVDEEMMAAEAEAAEKEETDEPDEPSEPVAPPADAPPAPAGTGTEEGAAGKQSERDDYARRFLLAAFFGLVVPLLWFYAIYLFLNAAFGPGTLSPANRNKLRAGGLLLALGFFSSLYLIWLYKDPFP
jgi:hypothetical protein